MSRFLHRPMFRRGGSTGEGITSGLTRQGYQGTDDPADQRDKPRDSSGADFWLNLGTNILAQPGGRPILQTLGTAAKEPLAKFQQSRAAKEKMDWERDWEQEGRDIQDKRFDEEMGLKRDELKQDWKIAELENRGEKQFMEERLHKYWDPIIEAETDPVKKAKLKQVRDLEIHEIVDLGYDISDKYKILSNAQAIEMAADRADNEIKYTKNKKTGLIWAEEDAGYDEFYQSLVNKYMRLSTLFLKQGEEELDAAGGRVGRAFGGGMTEDVNVMTKTPGGISDINISETMGRDPGETNEINISYEQLRDRLPSEISNEIVLLLSQSYEAFADFAELQTQADVNEFNTKYNVQLFLPQQTGA